MATFKKKDFKKIIIESDDINELVDDEGAKISGDEKYNKGVDVKTGPINMPGDTKGIAPTTDDHKSAAVQPRNWWWSLSYGYGQGSGKSPTPSGAFNESDDIGEQRVRKMVEDILSKKSSDKEMVNKRKSSDIKRNEIPDIKDLSDTNIIVVGKIKDLIESIKSLNMSGEEISIVLNYFLKNIKTDGIPSDYKNIIRKEI